MLITEGMNATNNHNRIPYTRKPIPPKVSSLLLPEPGSHYTTGYPRFRINTLPTILISPEHQTQLPMQLPPSSVTLEYSALPFWIHDFPKLYTTPHCKLCSRFESITLTSRLFTHKNYEPEEEMTTSFASSCIHNPNLYHRNSKHNDRLTSTPYS